LHLLSGIYAPQGLDWAGYIDRQGAGVGFKGEKNQPSTRWLEVETARGVCQHTSSGVVLDHLSGNFTDVQGCKLAGVHRNHFIAL
jgi:hypothetical protein